MPAASSWDTWPRRAGSNAIRTAPAMSAARARPRTVTPQPASADSRPAMTWLVSATAASIVAGAPGNAAGSRVRLTQVCTSAAAAGAVATSWLMISCAWRGAVGLAVAATWLARVAPGSGAVLVVTLTQRAAGR
jgi:hypothetical protein